LELKSREDVFAPGPDGQLFGRNFDMAQFAWTNSLEPPCFLFTSTQIPGPYPDYPNGWGGGNAAGYNNPDFDAACDRARNTLPGAAGYVESQQQAQLLFAEDLPVLPLYIAPRQAASRPDFCGLVIDPSADSILWNLESFDYGEGCSN
jgi:peptide/nickel transport system substrate-binding protein